MWSMRSRAMAMDLLWQLLAIEGKDEPFSGARRRPGERNGGICALEGLAVVADFDDERAPGAQMCARRLEDGARVLEPVRAAGKRHRRLLAILVGQLPHRGGLHVRRIRDDEVVLAAGERGE